MKLAHLADLHFGIIVNHISMIEEQKHMMNQIMDLLCEEKPDAVLLCGDIYDKAVPSAEATALLDDFFTKLAEENLKVFVIAGNHDSGDRLAYAAGLIESKGIYICGAFEGKLRQYTLQDDYGDVNICLLPYIRQSYVNRYIEKEEDKAKTYTEAVRKAIETGDLDFTGRNVLLSHQFVTGAKTDPDGSEQLVIGGLDEVSASAYEGFDYIALGHIHNRQRIADNIYYAGTPLKYSFSEENKTKSITFIDLLEKGNMHIYERELVPLHDMRTIRGRYRDVLLAGQNDARAEDYIRFILTDETEADDAMRHLRTVYPNAMRLDYDNSHTRMTAIDNKTVTENKSPLELFRDFYVMRNQSAMTSVQEEIITEMVQEIFNSGGAQ